MPARGFYGTLLSMMMSNQAPDDQIRLEVRPPLGDMELNELFEASWPDHRPASFGGMLAHSLCWVAAYSDGALVGFVNVATDGGIHAFILNTTVHPRVRRQGLGVRLVQRAAQEARSSGASWLHVDYEPHLEEFYARCGFRPTAAGLMQL